MEISGRNTLPETQTAGTAARTVIRLKAKEVGRDLMDVWLDKQRDSTMNREAGHYYYCTLGLAGRIGGIAIQKRLYILYSAFCTLPYRATLLVTMPSVAGTHPIPSCDPASPQHSRMSYRASRPGALQVSHIGYNVLDINSL